MNIITTEQSINNQSFFKLPLIFIAIFFVIYFSVTQFVMFVMYLMMQIPFEVFVKNFVYSFLALLLPLFLFFVTAVFCCQKYRLHSVIDSWLKVALIAIVFAFLYMFLSFFISFISSFFIMQLSERMAVSLYQIAFWLTIIYLFIRVFTSILFIFILIFLFYLFAKKDVSLRAMFKLEGEIGSRVHAQVYSLLMLFLSLVVISYSLNTSLKTISISSDIDNIEIIYLLTTFISLFISYIVFYFSTHNCFKHIESTVKLGKLVVTVLLTYLFIFLTSLAIVSVFFIFIWQNLTMGYYMGESAIVTMMLTLLFVGCVVNFLLYFVFSRLSVKIMYG